VTVVLGAAPYHLNRVMRPVRDRGELVLAGVRIRDARTAKEAEMAEEAPLLDTIADMTAASLERCDLDPRDLMLVRIAALAAAGAPPASYLVNAGTASDVGITIEDVQGVLVAIAPIVGTARAVTAAGNIAAALGFAIAAIEAEIEAELGT
jgi:alkylhydroperoxidase/carboxymuconolactone decarboxylase family protein YurZ